MVRILFSLSILFCVNSAYAQAASSTESNISEKATYVLCKSGNVVRTLRVQLNGKSCRAIYTKEGTDTEVGKAQKPEVCFDVASKIRITLEKNKWKCKDISQTRVSSSLE